MSIHRQLSRAALLAALLSPQIVHAQDKPVAPTTPPIAMRAETPAQHDARMAWFREARFGMFIHWGVYAVPAGAYDGKTNYGEWFLQETQMPVSQYEQYAKQFNPTKFDAARWVQIAKDAGMKYIVITSKHHDGFGMFPAQNGDWNLKRTPFGRDPLMELARECRKAGLKLCFYHSIMDWHHEDYLPRRAWNDVAAAKEPNPDMDKYVLYLKAQLKQLLTNYGPIGILWFDGEWEPTWTHERGVDLYNYVRALQPDIIVNNRVGKNRGGMQGMNKGEGVGDYGTPEQEIPATGFGPGVDWESCMTMNGHWGYNAADQNWKSTQTLVHNLIDCASKGGNYLLNVGPMATGEFPQPSIERLAQIGAWMKTNREAIYDTSASPFKRLTWGRATTKRNGKNTTLYLHVWEWPTDGNLRVPGLKNPIKSARLLGTKSQPLAALNFADGVRVQVPTNAPDALSTTIALTFQGAPIVEEMPLSQSADGSLQLLPVDATPHGQVHLERAADSKDNFGFWLNAADTIDWNFRAVRPGRYQVLAEVAAPKTTAFNVLLKQGDKTQTLAAKVEGQGDYTDFRKVALGEIEIGANGATTLQIVPDAANWQAMNLRGLSLQAAK